MDPDTERLIRRDIRARWAPLFILLWIFIGTVVGLGFFGLLIFFDKFLHTHRFYH